MNSTKSLIGHVLGGASGVEAVATIKAIQTGWLHPTINLENPEEVRIENVNKAELRTSLSYRCLKLIIHTLAIQGVDPVAVVAGVKQQQKVRVALSNSFGFGGHNSCVMFRALH